MKVSLLTGGNSPHYVLGLLSGLVAQGVTVDFIGNDEMKDADMVKHTNVTYLNLRGNQTFSVPIRHKLVRVLKYYFRLIKYAAQTDSRIFHIQWLNKFTHFDRTLLNAYYKLLGKKLVFTAHNINEGERDGNDSLLNRLTLRFMYNIVDYIIVHTNKMKSQLIDEFGITENKVVVIPHGMMNVVPKTGLTRERARQKIGINEKEKVLLFFGIITRYKGLKYLLLALKDLKMKYDDMRLIIAGKVAENMHAHWQELQNIIDEHHLKKYIIDKSEFIPDRDIEIYFQAADVLILPYVSIFQSGVPFLAYNFGLPVIATDVGALREDVIEGETGYICQRQNPEDLGKKIDQYFSSALFEKLQSNRNKILFWANNKYSWEAIAENTCAIYNNLL